MTRPFLTLLEKEYVIAPGAQLCDLSSRLARASVFLLTLGTKQGGGLMPKVARTTVSPSRKISHALELMPPCEPSGPHSLPDRVAQPANVEPLAACGVRSTFRLNGNGAEQMVPQLIPG
jgi:hypothetical protein